MSDGISHERQTLQDDEAPHQRTDHRGEPGGKKCPLHEREFQGLNQDVDQSGLIPLLTRSMPRASENRNPSPFVLRLSKDPAR